MYFWLDIMVSSSPSVSTLNLCICLRHRPIFLLLTLSGVPIGFVHFIAQLRSTQHRPGSSAFRFLGRERQSRKPRPAMTIRGYTEVSTCPGTCAHSKASIVIASFMTLGTNVVARRWHPRCFYRCPHNVVHATLLGLHDTQGDAKIAFVWYSRFREPVFVHTSTIQCVVDRIQVGRRWGTIDTTINCIRTSFIGPENIDEDA